MKLTHSRETLLRRVQSIGVDDQLLVSKKDLPFQTLKRSKRSQMGQVLRDRTKLVELFGFRDQNATSIQDKERDNPQVIVEHPDESDILHKSQQMESIEYFSKMSCLKCKDSFVYLPKANHRKPLQLKSVQMRPGSKEKRQQRQQKVLSKHTPLQNRDLPPLLFQNHISKPPGYEEAAHMRKSSNASQGRLQFGRIAEGIDEEQLQLLMKQKMIPYLKRQVSSTPSLTQKQMNIFKCKKSGNVLGKAYSEMRTFDEEGKRKEDLERELIREKERQINELIFGKSTYQQVDMQDFI